MDARVKPGYEGTGDSSDFGDQFPQQFEGGKHRSPPDFATAEIAEADFLVQRLSTSRGGEMHEARGLVGAAAGTGNAGDRYSYVTAGFRQRAFGHGAGGFGTHGAELAERLGGYTKHRRLGLIGIGHVAAVEDFG